jgi:uncharacterized protein
MTKLLSQDTAATFKELSYFNESTKFGYQLLPFRFIKLDSSRYVLTNIAGEYIVLSRDLLTSFIEKKLTPDLEIYNSLKTKHFLLDNDSNVAIELLATKYRTKLVPISNFTSLHMFVVTLRCDHSCPYCQVSRQSEDRLAYDMSEDTAMKALDFTFRSPSPSIKIEFQGGESLLNFELVKFIVFEAIKRNEKEKRNIQFVIATNLSQINDDILQFCLKFKVLISTSLDGPEKLHNTNRPRPGNNSYELTQNGINRVREYLGPDSVAALMTTTKNSFPLVEEIIDEYIKSGFNSIFLRPLSPYGFAIKTKSFDAYQIDEWLEFYKRGLSYIINLNKQGLLFIEEYTSLILTKMLTPFGTSYVDLQSPSGIGISAIVFNYDGEVYASDESRMLAEMGDKKFRIGNLESNTYEEIMLSDALIEPIESSIAESSPGCSDCGFLPYCGSDPVYHYATQGDVVGKKPLSSFCTKNMAIFRHLITIMEDDKETADILNSWVRH